MTKDEALAQLEHKPVALPCCGYSDASAIKWNTYNQVVQCHNCGQVYIASPQRKPLTDEMVTAAARQLCKIHAGECQVDEQDTWTFYSDQFKRDARCALEAAHGIKE